MLNLLNWEKPIMVNGVVYGNSAEAYKAVKDFNGELKIQFNFAAVPQVATQPKQTAQPATASKPEIVQPQADDTIYKIKVRQYMTKQWDFNDQKNNGVPMPLRVMVGRILQETKGMVKMELWGKPMPSSICCACGRTLTHPVSLLYGIGPECGGHFHINPYGTEEELNANYENLRQKMADIKWTGWIIKSAVEEKEVYNENFSERLAEVV